MVRFSFLLSLGLLFVISLTINHREGVNEDQCAILVNHEAVRVVNKNNYGFGVKIFNIYMVGIAFKYLWCTLTD